MPDEKRLYSVADQLSPREIHDLHKSYGNSGLVTLMDLVGLAESYKSAAGSEVTNFAGEKLLDFTGGYGANSLGHNPERIKQAVLQAWGEPNFLQIQLPAMSAKLRYNLAQITPGGLKHSSLGNSGTEAVEAAWKMARKSTGRSVILAVEKGFHGKTGGSLSITGNPKYQKDFQPLMPDCEIVPFGDIEALRNRLEREDVAAFFIEPVQGEGGVRLHPEGYLKEAERLCHQFGTLFVLDEVQTGLGRTGKLFAAEHWGLEPDIMCLAKALGGSVFPISATIAKEEVWNKAYGGTEDCLLHTSTFAEGSLACAAAIETINIIEEENLPQTAAKKGDYLLRSLRQLQEKHVIVKEVRGLGLLIGIEINTGIDADNAGFVGQKIYENIGSMYIAELRHKHGILVTFTLNNPSVIRVAPAFDVTYDQLDQFIDALDEVLAKNSSTTKLIVNTGVTAVKSAVSRGIGRFRGK